MADNASLESHLRFIPDEKRVHCRLRIDPGADPAGPRHGVRRSVTVPTDPGELGAAALAAGRAGESEATPGPHRTDLDAWHGVTEAPAERCSTGEQKAILLSVILTAARLSATLRGREGMPPS